MHALIVDDKEENLYYLRVLLEAHGWTVESARHGAEALVKSRKTLPDVVISDLLMPIMDGYTLLRHWKVDPRLKKVPFIVYTATYTDAEDERLALGLGADAFILKPSEPEDFLARLRVVQANAAAVVPSEPHAPVGDDSTLLKLYSETLIRKLEEKMLQLEESNRALQRETSELQLRDRAIQAISQGITISDPHAPDNPIIYASPSFERLTGYSPDEILGKNCRLLQGEETSRSSVAHLHEAVHSARACTVELLNYRKDGSTFWNNLSLSPVLDASGRLTHFVGVQTDVTERRQLEAQFHQAQKIEALGQLAAGTAHDFNNLLAVIVGYTSMALDGIQPGEPLHEDLQQVLRAGERASDLTRQLLAFSRQQVLQPEVVDLNQRVLGMEKMIRQLIGKNTEIVLVTPPSSGSVRMDPTQVDQIILNLAVNARDAMPSGGKLTIETANVELDAAYATAHSGVVPGPYVVLGVSDTGVGMDDATRERIFEPFFTTKKRGTGLGLATVFGIVKQTGGHVSVVSAADQGTSFRIYLPRVDLALTTVSVMPAEPTTLRGAETVLVVEDDAQVRQTTREILRRHGYDVLEAQNAGEAFLICEQSPGPIHLLVTDVVMPRMTGKQLAERVAPLHPEMKVLLMSGYADDSIIQEGVLAPGIAFLQKPFVPGLLLKKVREALAGRTP